MKCEVCQREFHSPYSTLVSVCSLCIVRGGAKPDAPEREENTPAPTDNTDEPTGFVGAEELTDLFPEFEIGEQLGAGGMGVVFRARQKSLDRSVAIKILNPKLLGDPEFEERFGREAKAMAMLSHPNIVGVHDFGIRGAYHFLVMEHVEGRDLQKLIRARSLESELAFSIIRQVCDALFYAHQKGVIHRDIKPGNILVDHDGVAKIGDFGLARIVHPDTEVSLTMTSAAMGTPAYIAPEQLEDAKSSDARSDIYALGVVVYEMLTGSTPSGNFPPPTSLLPRRNRRLDDAILRAMDPNPESRLSDLREISGIVAKTERPPRTRKTGSTHLSSPLAKATWAVLAALALIGGLIYWNLQDTPETRRATVPEVKKPGPFKPMPTEAFLPTAAFPFDPAFDSKRQRGGVLKQWSSSDETLDLAPAAGVDDLVSIGRVSAMKAWMGLRSNGRNVSDFPPLNGMRGITHSSSFFNLRRDGECIPRGHHVVKAADALPPKAVDLAQTNDFSVLVTPEGRAVFVTASSWQPLVTQLEKRLEDVNDVVSVDSWGFTFALLRESGDVFAWHLYEGVFPEPENGGSFQEIAVGEAHIVGLDRNQKLSAWSAAPFVQREHVQRSLRVPGNENKIVRVESVARINAAQREDGSWVAWGDNETGLIEKINTLGPALDLVIFDQARDATAKLVWIEPRPLGAGEGE